MPSVEGKQEGKAMIDDICGYLKNYFEQGIYSGSYTIENGSVSLDFLQDGQYFRIVGSVFNDGVYQYPATDLTDETFDGAIWAMALPRAFLAVCEEIETYCSSPQSTITPYTSESWGGYSYTKSTDSTGVQAGWQTLFAKKLNRWRKL